MGRRGWAKGAGGGSGLAPKGAARRGAAHTQACRLAEQHRVTVQICRQLTALAATQATAHCKKAASRQALTRAAQVGAELGKGKQLLAQHGHTQLGGRLHKPPRRRQLAHVVAAHCRGGGGGGTFVSGPRMGRARTRGSRASHVAASRATGTEHNGTEHAACSAASRTRLAGRRAHPSGGRPAGKRRRPAGLQWCCQTAGQGGGASAARAR